VSDKTGFLVQDLDEMVQAIPRIDEIDREAARLHVEQHFSAQVMAKNYVSLFSQRLRGIIIFMSEQNLLQTELEYFQKHKQEYLKLYKGQFVLIKGEEFAGTFTTEAEAYKAGLEKFGNEPFLIKPVLDNDETASFPALTVGVINVRL